MFKVDSVCVSPPAEGVVVLERADIDQASLFLQQLNNALVSVLKQKMKDLLINKIFNSQIAPKDPWSTIAYYCWKVKHPRVSKMLILSSAALGVRPINNYIFMLYFLG